MAAEGGLTEERKLSRFNEAFAEPVPFCDGTLALSAELFPTREEAEAEFRRCLGEYPDEGAFDLRGIHPEWVRFQFPPEALYHEFDGRPIWVTGATGKAAKPVWVLPMVP